MCQAEPGLEETQIMVDTTEGRWKGRFSFVKRRSSSSQRKMKDSEDNKKESFREEKRKSSSFRGEKSDSFRDSKKGSFREVKRGASFNLERQSSLDETSSLKEKVRQEKKSGTPEEKKDDMEEEKKDNFNQENKLVPTSSNSIDDRWEPVWTQKVIKTWDLSEEMQRQFFDLKRRLSDIDHPMNTPENVIRFCCGRQNKQHEAEEIFRKMIEARSWDAISRDDILDVYDPPELLLKQIPNPVVKGEDRVGDPIILIQAGMINVKKLLKNCTDEEIITQIMWAQEFAQFGYWIKDYARRHDRPVKKMLCLVDMKGFGTEHFSRSALTVFSKTMQRVSLYPEVMKKVILIRAPALFRLAWALFKPLMKPKLVKKIVFVGSNYMDVLDEHMDIDLLPKSIYDDGNGSFVPPKPPSESWSG